MSNNYYICLLILCAMTLFSPYTTTHASPTVAVPKGFESIFNASQTGIFDIYYGDVSLGTISVEYDLQQALLMSPRVLVDQIMAPDNAPMKISYDALLTLLSAPLERLGPGKVAHDKPAVLLNESDSSLRLIFPGNLFSAASPTLKQGYIPHTNNAGFVHAHNLNYLTDSYGDNVSLSSSEVLNLTGNSYIKGAWSYASQINFNVEELALYLEHENIRFKSGRQRLSDNLLSSTPSMTYSFFNPVNFDGISLGRIGDNYINPGYGAASPVTVYLQQAGTVEIYRQGRLIDLQQFPEGLHHLDTRSWPSGGYEVRLVSKMVNGVYEEKIQPFYKRNGPFHSGEIEFIVEFGRYDPYKSEISSSLSRECTSCGRQDSPLSLKSHYFANLSLAYTTLSALSAGVGILVDDGRLYGNVSLDVPVNNWLAERFYFDSLYGDDGSHGYQFGWMKNLNLMGMNFSYRKFMFNGDEEDFRRFAIVPAYDFTSMQLGATTVLPWSLGLSVSYGVNTLSQEYGQLSKTNFKNWDINLNRDFPLADRLSLRVDLGYHRGANEFTSRYSFHSVIEDRFYTQFSLSMRERSYNHYQSLNLRTRLTEENDDNTYSASYALNVDNPEFNRGSKYALNASLDHGQRGSTNASVGTVVDNRFGFTSFGASQSISESTYHQQYFSQRSGFAIGNSEIAWGKVESNSALIIDATDLAEDHYFEVRNDNNEPVVVKGGEKTTLSIMPYKKIAPKAEQLFTSGNNAFYDISTKSTSTWALPGQVYHVKLAAIQNLTVTGRLYFAGRPLSYARIVGANALSDEEGFFIGDFQLESRQKLISLTLKKEDQTYSCPLMEEEIKMMQGVMQIREVNCEIE